LKILATMALLTILAPVAALAQEPQTDTVVILETTKGKIVIEFFPDDAPGHVDNFIGLVDDGYYDGIVFHRIISDFMVQAGDPTTKEGEATMAAWGQSGPGYAIDAEFNNIKHKRGIVSMARTNIPDSAGSQFFIVHNDSNFLDGQYTVFGRIATDESYRTVDALAAMETNLNTGVPTDWEDAVIIQASTAQRDTIPDLLPWAEPARTSEPVTITEDSPRYTSEKLGISFDAPPGWDVQELDDPPAPDLTIIGPLLENIPVTIYIATEDAGNQTLSDFIQDEDELIQAESAVNLVDSEPITVGGIDGVVRTIAIDNVPIGGGSIILEMQYRQTIILRDGAAYAIVYVAEPQSFEQFEDSYQTVLDTLVFTDDTVDVSVETQAQDAEPGGSCLIATAVYGTEMAAQVQQLRELRDDTIMQTGAGSAFMDAFNKIYYSFSPQIADLEREHPALREATRAFLAPMLVTLSVLTNAEIDSDAEIITYGISIILANIGIYLVAPTIAIYSVLRHARAKY